MRQLAGNGWRGPALTGLMRVVCSWCGVWIRDQPCAPSMAGLVSHGLCARPECHAKARS